MLKPVPPMSNNERQRRFRERHPGYYGRLHRERNARIEAMQMQRQAAQQALAKKREPLMLPAPVQTIELPTMSELDRLLAEARKVFARLEEQAGEGMKGEGRHRDR